MADDCGDDPLLVLLLSISVRDIVMEGNQLLENEGIYTFSSLITEHIGPKKCLEQTGFVIVK